MRHHMVLTGVDSHACEHGTLRLQTERRVVTVASGRRILMGAVFDPFFGHEIVKFGLSL